ncbi:BA14K family protein [Mesorhizobium sp. PAMC28654]|uniref:BA14K family protein n=1 Tax=Mesorhizobium sp. PAMC28654 TaxID=2880934 RepID=UPI001D0BDAA4|nr:BA14K family protein [Mesorhizobium sp. PAMC28654]UDL90272.1 BA14K family protein [Mesorhizobium sp. PAMC28654]
MMNKVMSGLLAATLSISFAATAAIPAEAAPIFVPQAPIVTPSDIQAVDFNPQLKNRHFRGNRNSGGHRNFNGNRNFGNRGNGGGYWNGHRGYSYYRPGYQRHGDYWFPLAAFAAGAVISGAIVNSEQNRGNSHVQWCYDRYRSYRASDNTFQPNNGPRQQCRSPY